MPSISQVLEQAAKALRIVGAPAAIEPGQSLSLTLSPPLEPLGLTEILSRPLDLELVDGASEGTITGKLPVGLPSVSNPTNIVERDISLDLVETLTGRLKGALPIPDAQQLMPEIIIKWVVKDEAGNVLREDDHYVAPNGLNDLFLSLLLIPEFADVGLTVPPPVKRFISAEVTLRYTPPDAVVGPLGDGGVLASGRRTAKALRLLQPIEQKVAVPGVMILVPVIPFPRLLVLAKDLNFQGPVALILPGTTFISSLAPILEILKRVRSVLSLLTSVARLAATLAGVNALLNMLDSPNVAIGFARDNNKLNDLNDIDLVHGPWYTRLNDIEAEDEISSFVYAAPPGRDHSVDLFAASDCDNDEGQLRVTTGAALVALCRSLHGTTPDLFPRRAPDTPFGATITEVKDRSHWGNCLSSVRFN